MKISIESFQDPQVFHLTEIGMREFDIPEAQVHWISETFDNFHKAQEYLGTMYRKGPIENTSA